MITNLAGRAPVRSVVFAVASVALVGLAAITYLELSSLELRRQAAGVLENGAPSVQTLTSARTSLRRLDGAVDATLLDAIVGGPFDAADRAAISDAQREFREDLVAYRRLPFYELEGELDGALQVEVQRLDVALDDLLVHLADVELRNAHAIEKGEWRKQSDAVDELLRQLVQLNASHVVEHAAAVDQVRERSVLVGVIIGSAALALALAAALGGAAAVRRYARRQEAKTEELEMFSSRVAHDLVSPLQAVAMALGAVHDQTRDAQLVRVSDRGLAALKRTRDIVDALLDFARVGGQPNGVGRASVSDVLSGVISEVRQRAQASAIELVLDTTPPVEVACPPGVLTVAITNLVNNALKYMGDSAVRRVCVRAELRADVVRFEVEDSGPGIAPEFATSAFLPYVRGQNEGGSPGLGLGLATTKRLIERYDGHIGVSHASSGGALFWFELPQSEWLPSGPSLPAEQPSV